VIRDQEAFARSSDAQFFGKIAVVDGDFFLSGDRAQGGERDRLAPDVDLEPRIRRPAVVHEGHRAHSESKARSLGMIGAVLDMEDIVGGQRLLDRLPLAAGENQKVREMERGAGPDVRQGERPSAMNGGDADFNHAGAVRIC
jgi:hypothetical protein